MTAYDQRIVRDTASPDAREIPQVVSRQVIEGVVKNSFALQLCQKRVMPARTERMPALSLLPTASWLTGGSQAAKDSAFKTTTQVQWNNVQMRAEEIAVMVPIPDAYVADVGVDLFGEIQPLLSQAIGVALDQAVFFGINSPWLTNSDSDSIYKRAVAAGNTVTYDPNAEAANQIGVLGKKLAVKGYVGNQFVTQPGFDWVLAADRTQMDLSPYGPGSGVDRLPGTLYGKPMEQVTNGAWDNTRALLFIGDFSKAIVGIRQDITFKLFDSGIITDNSTPPQIQYNAMQQDGKILRVVARFAFATVNPISGLNSDLSGYPFGVLRPTGAPAT